MRRKTASPTSYDVAAHAGVSQAVVSRAFQAKSPIAPQTRAKVLKSAHQLGYQPNAFARSLITKRSGMAGVLLTDATQRDSPDLLYFLGHALVEHRFQPLLFPTRTDSEGGAALEQALAFGVDGVVSCLSLADEDAAQAHLRQRPLVLVNRHTDSQQTSMVACDHVGGARLIASRLYAAGHRRFAAVSGPPGAPVSDLRVNGFVDRLHELGIHDVTVMQGDYHYESGHAAAIDLLGRARGKHKRTVAIFCVNDAMALGMLDAVRFALMLHVPRDVSVVGFDDIPTGSRPAYLLTTVSQPFEEMARMAARTLRAQVDDSSAAPLKHLLRGKLIERASAQLIPERQPA